jgi:4-hydroxy-tetrahydrodipicolinate synthase
MSKFIHDPADRFPTGSYPAMLTAFHADLSIDWPGVEQLTDYAIRNGSAGIFAAGGSAEVTFMSDPEKVDLIDHIVRYAKGRVPVLGCAITAVPLAEQAELVRQIYATGVDAVVITVSQLAAKEDDDRTWLRNAEALLEMIPEEIPLAMYECPMPYHRLLTEETIAWAARTGRFRFLKDTCCNAAKIRARLEIVRGSRLQLFNANTETLLDSLQAGAEGFCGIGANYAPDLYAWLCREFKNHPAPAAELHRYVQDCVSLTEGSGYPVCAKEYLRRHGVELDRYSRRRPPELSDDLLAALDAMRMSDAAWRARLLG